MAGCAGEPSGPVEGPFTGVTYRFAVDRLRMPMHRAAEWSIDLNGDGKLYNQLGNIAGELAANSDFEAPDDLVASGALAPVLEITTDDPRLMNDETVGVRFLAVDGAHADVLGGRLRNGVLHTNLPRQQLAPAFAPIQLPLFIDADPIAVEALGIEVDLATDGKRGFDGALHGALRPPAYRYAAYAGMLQMLASRPEEHLCWMRLFDLDQDGKVDYDEFQMDSIIKAILVPDVQLFGDDGAWAPSPLNQGRDSLSLGFGFHARPCESGRCSDAMPRDACRDRALDGDETDIDCGGSCHPCAGQQHCFVDADCQSRQCRSQACAPPSCSDGVRDGFETGVDCGYYCPNMSCTFQQLCPI
jgi:hypothetical protein